MSDEEIVKGGTNPMEVIEAVKKIGEALKPLDEAAASQALKWATELYAPRNVSGRVQAAVTMASANPSENLLDSYGTLPDFYAACGPGTDAEKALVVGYWHQFREGAVDFDTQRVNTELKHMGYQIGNITRAFDNLESTQPRLVVQVRKLGNTKQARKRLKLTVEGKKVVEQMLARSGAA